MQFALYMMAETQHDHTPCIISMEADPQDEVESEYRVKAGSSVKYITIVPGTLHPELLSYPLASLPALPYDDQSWTVALISRDPQSGELVTQLSDRKLAGVENIWHERSFDVLKLQRTKQLSPAAFEALLSDRASTQTLQESPSTSENVEVFAKIARFDWEVPRIERETRIYQLLHESSAEDLAPRFLGHLHEGGRVMGFLLEKVQGRNHASIEDLHDCECALKRFHALGLIHGDVNRYNFLVGKNSVQLIDFEASEEVGDDEESQLTERRSLRAELTEETGRGGGFRPVSND